MAKQYTTPVHGGKTDSMLPASLPGGVPSEEDNFAFGIISYAMFNEDRKTCKVVTCNSHKSTRSIQCDSTQKGAHKLLRIFEALTTPQPSPLHRQSFESLVPLSNIEQTESRNRDICGVSSADWGSEKQEISEIFQVC